MFCGDAKSRLAFPGIPIVRITAALTDDNRRAEDEQRYGHDGVAEFPSQHGGAQSRQFGAYDQSGVGAENWLGRPSGQEGLYREINANHQDGPDLNQGSPALNAQSPQEPYGTAYKG
jgi:hypothetical protein